MTSDPSTHTRSTPILDFDTPTIDQLVTARGWRQLDTQPRITAIYSFVRDEVPFGYNRTDSIPASEVLRDGYGQCNTKTSLLMALLRATGVPCRVHGATIDKRLQLGVVTGLFYRLAPTNIIHSWAEVWFEERWVALEGVILDRAYLSGVTTHLERSSGPLIGYGVGTDDLANPAIEFRGEPTSIQMTGVNQDFGVFSDPDAFYARTGQNLSGFRAWLFAAWVRHRMNARVERLRGCAPSAPCSLVSAT